MWFSGAHFPSEKWTVVHATNLADLVEYVPKFILLKRTAFLKIRFHAPTNKYQLLQSFRSFYKITVPATKLQIDLFDYKFVQHSMRMAPLWLISSLTKWAAVVLFSYIAICNKFVLFLFKKQANLITLKQHLLIDGIFIYEGQYFRLAVALS